MYTPNHVDASGYYGELLTDRNFPAYFHEYTVEFVGGSSFGTVNSSIIGLVPANEEKERILNVECSGTLGYIPVIDGRLRNWEIQFNVLNIQVFNQFILRYALEGSLIVNEVSDKNWNANTYMTYAYDIERGILLFRIQLENVETLPPTGDLTFNFNVFIQDDVIAPQYVRTIYALQNFPYFLTGQGQTILVPTFLETGYLVSDIVTYLRAQGLQKSEQAIASQISYVNVTDFIQFFWNGNYYPIPASDGFLCNPPLAQLGLGSSEKLAINLEYIFTIAPNANVLIAYYGCNCDPQTGTRTSRIIAEMQLIQWMRANTNRYDIVCDTNSHLRPVNYNDLQLETFQQTFDKLYAEYKMLVTTSGNTYAGAEPDLYNVGSYLLSMGGSMYVPMPNTQGEVQVAYTSSAGGFYPTIVDESFPSYQVGLVEFPGATPETIQTAQIIGVPTMCGVAADLTYVFNGITKSGSNTFMSVAPQCALLALVNQVTQTKWRYLDIFYYEFDYLFQYINKGSNGTYDASQYNNWNPITGLGYIDGERIIRMLDPSTFSNGGKVMITSKSVQYRMGNLNFFPPTGFYEQEIRQPVLGPQSYWSYLVIYRITAANTIDTSTTEIKDGDAIAIFSAVPSLYWVMVWNLDGTVRLQKYENVVNETMKWVIGLHSRNSFYENTTFQAYGDPNLYLSSKVGATSPHSSPSLTDGLDETCIFFLRRHSWFVDDDDLYQKILDTDYSYYMNITNRDYFMTSNFTQSNYLQGRQLASSFDLKAFYGPFSPYPEFLMIPISDVDALVAQNDGLFMAYNIRIQAFVRFVYNASTNRAECGFLNINNIKSSPMSFVHDQCVLFLEKFISTSSPELFSTSVSFGPSYANSSPARYNDFYTNALVYSPAGYFRTPNLSLLDNNDDPGPIPVSIGVSPVDSLWIFHVDPTKIYKLSTNRVWLRQVLYLTSGFPNAAIYPNTNGGGTLPFMGRYDRNVVSQGDTTGSWILRNGFDSDTWILDDQLNPSWLYVNPSASFNFNYRNVFLADVSNVQTWQPQMLNVSPSDGRVNWQLLPSTGPFHNYLYTGCNYDIRSVSTSKFISTIMNLSHTPSMLDAGPTNLRPNTFLCIYTQSNDLS